MSHNYYEPAKNVMCRSTLSVEWDGTLCDYNFNQIPTMPMNHGAPSTVFDFDTKELSSRKIVLDSHCFTCTLGAGSSCRGATA